MAHRDGDYDIREDEEQEAKEGECLQLLVSAGYFRARIKGLSAFDKIVGGLCWCIQGCNVDIDVDLLFHENLTIGQKIALTEKIVRSLSRMECPHAVEPHQIQGRDYRHVFPVVQWLVKRVIGRRDEMTSAWRQLASAQYAAEFEQRTRRRRPAEETALAERLGDLRRRFAAKRRLRQPASCRLSGEAAHARATLLEYGVGVSGVGVGGVALSGREAADRRQSAEASASAEEEAAATAAAMAEMGAAAQHRRLAPNVVGSLLGLRSEQVLEAVRDYDEKRQQLRQQAEQLQDPRQRREAARRQLEAASDRATVAEQRAVDAGEQLLEHRRHVEELETRRLAASEQLASCPDAGRLASSRQRESEFKAECRAASSEAQAQLQRLRELLAAGDEASATSAPGGERLAKVEAQLAATSERLSAARAKLATVTQSCASLRRRIDEFPSQEEVSQYIRRLMELAEQASLLHKQTKQFYSLYNSVGGLRDLLEREVDLLTSIEENFRKTERSPQGRQELLEQLQKIVDNAGQNRDNAERKLATEKAKRDAMNADRMSLVEAERRYNRLVKELRQEAARNQRLTEAAAQA